MSVAKIIIGVVVLGIIGALAWYLIAPAFQILEVNEDSPLADLEPAQRRAFKAAMEESKDDIFTKDQSMPSEARLIAQGDFKPHAHDVAGRAVVITHDNQTTLRFENFVTINGPDVRIYLSRDLTDRDYIEISPLKATHGNVNYSLKPGIDLAAYNKVLVWCEDFSVLFSYAELTPVQ